LLVHNEPPEGCFCHFTIIEPEKARGRRLRREKETKRGLLLVKSGEKVLTGKGILLIIFRCNSVAEEEYLTAAEHEREDGRCKSSRGSEKVASKLCP